MGLARCNRRTAETHLGHPEIDSRDCRWFRLGSSEFGVSASPANKSSSSVVASTLPRSTQT